MLVIAIVMPTLIGYYYVSNFLTVHQDGSPSPFILNSSLAIGFGYGISSCMYFLYSFIDNSCRLLILTETLILVILIALCSRSNKLIKYQVKLTFNKKFALSRKFQWLLSASFFCALTMALIVFLVRSSILPHGGWDAWQHWNLLAKFMSRGGDRWTEMFSCLLAEHHPDYPLLIPATIARCWKYAGFETQTVPIMIAMLFTFATIGLIYSSLAILRNSVQGLFAGLLLLGTTNFIIVGSKQYADVPIGFYFLATIVLFCFQDRWTENPYLSLLAGITTGFSCWTKNEGFLFLISIIMAHSSAVFISNRRKSFIKQRIYFVTGLAPILAMVIFFKLKLAPPNDIMSFQGELQTLARITDYSRYMHIAKALVMSTINTMPLLIIMIYYLLRLGTKINKSDKVSITTALITLATMIIGYSIVYLITPFELQWHLDTSLYRLLLQLWPSIIFVYCLVINDSSLKIPPPPTSSHSRINHDRLISSLAGYTRKGFDS